MSETLDRHESGVYPPDTVEGSEGEQPVYMVTRTHGAAPQTQRLPPDTLRQLITALRQQAASGEAVCAEAVVATAKDLLYRQETTRDAQKRRVVHTVPDWEAISYLEEAGLVVWYNKTLQRLQVQVGGQTYNL